MRFRKTSVWIFAGLLLSATAAGQGTNVPPVKEGLPNFQKIDEHLYRGAQPTDAGIATLKALKVVTVIDLRGEKDRVKAERQLVEAAGMSFVSVPMSNWGRPQDADVEKILKIIENPENQPVFIHCRRGADRTGTIAAVYRIAHYNWTAKQALTEAKAHKIGWWQFWMKDYIEDYYRDFHKKAGQPAARIWLPSGVITPLLPVLAADDPGTRLIEVSNVARPVLISREPVTRPAAPQSG